MPQPYISTLLPYTTLFRSVNVTVHADSAAGSTKEDSRRECLNRFAGPSSSNSSYNKNRRQRFKHSLLESDRKSTRLNSSHGSISYAVFCLKIKNGTDV